MGKRDLFIKIHKPMIELANEIPSSDKLILMGNHPNKLDSLLISSLSSDITFVTNPNEKKSLLVKSLDCDLHSKNMGNLASLYIALLENNVLCIFPEGEINDSDELKPFMPGAMTLAVRSGAKIMPFAITGSYNIFKGDPLKINVGEPFIANIKNTDVFEKVLKKRIIDLKKK